MTIENWLGTCWHCQHQLKAHDYQRENRCPACSRATHCCRNCEYYQPGIANSCKEPIADHVNDKDRSNFCDYFSPASRSGTTKSNADQLLEDAENLFS